MNMRIFRVAAIVFGLLFVLTGIAFVVSGVPLHEQKLVHGSYSTLRIIFGEQWGRYVCATFWVALGGALLWAATRSRLWIEPKANLDDADENFDAAFLKGTVQKRVAAKNKRITTAVGSKSQLPKKRVKHQKSQPK